MFAGVFASAAFADPPAEPAPEAPPALIEGPRWEQRPTGYDFANNYPRQAIAARAGGRVVLDCLVRANGRLTCTVESEEPAGLGFGEASLRVARRFRMSAHTASGEPTEGGRVRVPMRWMLSP